MGLSPSDFQAFSEFSTAMRFQTCELKHASITECTTCELDEATNKSVDLDCDECGGFYWKVTYTSQICNVRSEYDRLDTRMMDSGEIRYVEIRLWVSKGEASDFRSIRDTERSYLIFEGIDFKVMNLWPTLVTNEYIVACQSINVEQFGQDRS